MTTELERTKADVIKSLTGDNLNLLENHVIPLLDAYTAEVMDQMDAKLAKLAVGGGDPETLEETEALLHEMAALAKEWKMTAMVLGRDGGVLRLVNGQAVPTDKLPEATGRVLADLLRKDSEAFVVYDELYEQVDPPKEGTEG